LIDNYCFDTGSSFFGNVKKKKKIQEPPITTRGNENNNPKPQLFLLPPPVQKNPQVSTREATSTTITSPKPIRTQIKPNSIPYHELTRVFTKIEKHPSRLVIVDTLAFFFRQLIMNSPEDVIPCVYLCVCTDVGPPSENLKMGVGEALLIRAISESTGTTIAFIKQKYQQEGDLGRVAQSCRTKQKTLEGFQEHFVPSPRHLTVRQVYETFLQIANASGTSSLHFKLSNIKRLLVLCQSVQQLDKNSMEEAKFLIRGLEGKLRIGLAEKTLLRALTYAFLKDEQENLTFNTKEKALALTKQAFLECPNYTLFVNAMFALCGPHNTHGTLEQLNKLKERCHLTLGTPISPMLAMAARTMKNVVNKFVNTSFTCEYKYDGERAQIHVISSNNSKPFLQVKIFSRNLEQNTENFPDIQQLIEKNWKTNNFQNLILDTEIVAMDLTTKKKMSFQILSTRSRKRVDANRIKVSVCVYMFDLLLLNDQSLLGKSLEERRRLLYETVPVEIPHVLEFARHEDFIYHAQATTLSTINHDTDSLERLEQFFQASLREQCEGLMIKALSSTYEPSKRSNKWLNLKKDYIEGIGDTMDLVPIGGYFGKGKRTGVYGGFLLACYDPTSQKFQCFTKVSTGLSDELLRSLWAKLHRNALQKPPVDYDIDINMSAIPDEWFEATYVWEIAGADFSLSPQYTAAKGQVEETGGGPPPRGLSLRFPRYVRSREDKRPSEATTSQEIAQLYKQQMTDPGKKQKKQDEEQSD
jgi:DNA ligase-1